MKLFYDVLSCFRSIRGEFADMFRVPSVNDQGWTVPNPSWQTCFLMYNVYLDIVHVSYCWWKKSYDKYAIIYNMLHIPGGCLGFLNHQQ